jgi:hypothetical protein
MYDLPKGHLLILVSALAVAACGRITPDQPGVVAVGTVVAFAGGRVPEGWLVCDGRALTRAAWPELFAVLDTSHGAGVSPVGEKAGDFNLPDYRGRFLRGLDLSEGGEPSGTDPEASRRSPARAGRGNRGNHVGSYQADATALPRDPSRAFRVSPAVLPVARGSAHRRSPGTAAIDPQESPVLPRASPATREQRIIGGDVETRPKNVAVQWIIRARP